MSSAREERPDVAHPSPESSAASDARAVITDIMARVSLSELRTTPMTSVCRAGAFMCSALRRENLACAIALNDEAGIIGEHYMKLGPKWQAEGLTAELLSFTRRVGADKLILGTTLSSDWQGLLSLNEVYRSLLNAGVTTVDIIEVTDGAFSSVFRFFSPEMENIYKEFSGKK